jgi:hypothetical protein
MIKNYPVVSIEDAFEQIREQSGGGLLNIEEIVTAFIKAEE